MQTTNIWLNDILERPRPDLASVVQVPDEVEDRACLVVDYMTSTGRT